jgi:hypothetical protein
MTRLFGLIAAFLFFGLLTPAYAGSPRLAMSAGPNACNGSVLSVTFYGSTANCMGPSPYASYVGFPGLTFTPGTLSGTGNTFETALDSTGVLHNFASGAKRCTTGGCTAEPAATNLMLNSQVYATSGAYWGCFNATFTNNTATAPDGTNTAATFTMTGAGGSCSNNNGGGTAQTPSTTYSDSFYYKAGTNNGIGIRAYDNTSAAGATCYASALGCTLNLTSYTNVSITNTALGTTGWYRVCITYTTPVTAALSTRLGFFPGPTGSETSGTTFVWGAQHETGSKCSSYIPTTTNAVTRSADTLTAAYGSNATYFATVYFNGGQNAYVVPTSPINLAAAGTPYAGLPISQLLVTTSQPVPQQAAAVGYKQVTFNTPFFSTVNTDTAGTEVSGFQWYPCNFFGYGTGRQTIVITSGVAAIQATNSVNCGFSSAGSIAGSPFYVGTAFGGGLYMEAQFNFNDALVNSANGWPSWWSMSLEHLAALSSKQWIGQAAGYEHYVEPDVFEYIHVTTPGSTWTASLHDWYGIFNSTCSPSAYCSYGINGVATVQAPAAYTTNHRYGMLWIPATGTTSGSYSFYFDGVQVGPTTTYTQYQATQAANGTISTGSPNITMSGSNPGNVATGDTVYDNTAAQLLGTVSSWSGTALVLQSNAAHVGSGSTDSLTFTKVPPPSAGTPWSFGVIDTNHIVIILDAGTDTPINVSSVNVWQANTSQNLKN